MIKSVIKDYAGLTLDVSNKLLGSPLLNSLSNGSALGVQPSQTEGKRRTVDFQSLSNPEQAILQAKNQNQTVVTPLVYQLSRGFFHEVPYQVDFGHHECSHLQHGPRQETDFVDRLLKRFSLGRRQVKLDGLYRIGGGNFFSQGEVENESYNVSCEFSANTILFLAKCIYQVGDTVVLAMDGLQQKLNEYHSLSSWPDKTADYFW
jgi:hypothetical protein